MQKKYVSTVRFAAMPFSVRGAAIALLALGCGMMASGQVLEIRPQATVSGAHVLLSDLVRNSAALPEGWGEREVATAPPPREERRLTLSDVAVALQKYDDMSRVVLRGRQMIELTSLGRPVEVAGIQDAVDEYVRGHSQWQERRFEVCSQRLGALNAPSGPMQIEVIRMWQEGGDRGGVFAEISLGDGAGAPVRIDLIELRPYWAFTRPASRGDLLSTGDMEKRWVPVGDAARYYPAEQDVTGMELRRNVQAGQMLAQGMLAEPVYVRRGEVVRVSYAHGGLSVTLRARALADGRRDERILCVNESSGQRMHVRIVGPREALLDDGDAGGGFRS